MWAKVSSFVLCIFFSMFVVGGWSAPQEAQAAITQLTAPTAINATTAPASGNVTIATSASGTRMLVVGVSVATNAAVSPTVNCTWGGTALTAVPNTGTSGTSSTGHTYLFYMLDNPTLMNGTARALTFTISTGTLTANSIHYAVYEGVDQVAPTGGSSNNGTTLNTINALSPTLNIQTGDVGFNVINLIRGASTLYRTVTTPAGGWNIGPAVAQTATNPPGGTSRYCYTSTTPNPADSVTHTPSGTAYISSSGMVVKAQAVNPTTAGTATAVNGGFTSINVSAPYVDDSNADNTLLVEYKRSADSTWTTWTGSALPHGDSPYATVITGLTTGTPYDVRVTYQDVDGINGTAVQTITGVTPAAIITTRTYYMVGDLTTDFGADGVANVRPTGTTYTSATQPGKGSVSLAEAGTGMRYYPSVTGGATATALKLYSAVYADNAVDISNISASAALRGLATSDTVKLDLYEYDPNGAADNGTLVASSAAKTLTGGTTTTQYTWTAANFTINGSGRVAQGHRLQFRFTWYSGTTGTPRIMFGATGTTTSTNFTFTETPIAGSNYTTTDTATAVKAGTTSISVNAPYTNDGNGDNTLLVEYKRSADSTWTTWTGAPLPHSATPYSTVITGLTKGTSYDVRVTYQDADGVNGTPVQTITGVIPDVIPVATTFYMVGDLTTNFGADGTANVRPTGTTYTSSDGLFGKTSSATAEAGTGMRFYPSMTGGVAAIALRVYTAPFSINAVDISNISASVAIRGLATSDTVKLDLYDYDPNGAADNGTLVASSTAKTVTGGTTTTQYTWTPANFTINGSGTVALNHRLQFRFTYYTATTGTPRIYFGATGALTSTNFTFTQTPVAGANPTTAGTATAAAAGSTRIKITAPYSDDGNSNNTLLVEYKRSIDPTYTTWQSVVHSDTPYISQITGLSANTAYDIRVTYQDVDGVNGTAQQVIASVTTPEASVEAYDDWTRVINDSTVRVAGAAVNLSGSFAVTAPAGSSRMLVLAITQANRAANTAPAAPTLVTYGGVNLKLATTNRQVSSRTHTWFYYLKDNAVMNGTSRPVVVNWAAGLAATKIDVACAVFVGVDQIPASYTVGTQIVAATGTTAMALGSAMPVIANARAIYVLNVANVTNVTVPTYTTNANWTSPATAAPTTYTGAVGTNYSYSMQLAQRVVPATDTTDAATTGTRNITSYYAMSAMVLPPLAVAVIDGAAVANQNVYSGDTSKVVDAFTMVGATTLTSIQVTGNVNTTSANISAVRIYKKGDSNTAAYSPAVDTLVGSGTFGATEGPADITVTEAVASTTNYIIVYDIASGAIANGVGKTFTGKVSATTPPASSTTDSGATLTLLATTTLGNGTAEPAAARLWKSSAATNLDAFTLKHNGTSPIDDDAINNLTVSMSPQYISGGSGGTLSKIKQMEVISCTDAPVCAPANTTIYGTLTAATTADTWNIPLSGLVATATSADYFVRIYTADAITPSVNDTSGTLTGYYSFTGSITNYQHGRAANRFVESDTAGQTHIIDVEKPVGPATATATTGLTTGGTIDLVWDDASDDHSGTLDLDKPFVIRRSAPDGNYPDPGCAGTTDGSTDLSTVSTVTINYSGRSVQDNGLIKTNATRYYYRVCAKDAEGNLSVGATSYANAKVDNICDTTPTISLTGADNISTMQIIKSSSSDPFKFQISNNDVGVCPDVNFTVELVEFVDGTTSSHFDKKLVTDSFPTTVTLGTGGAGAVTGKTLNVYITGTPAVQQLEQYKFALRVSSPGNSHGAPVDTAQVTGLLNDMPPIVHNSNNMAKYQYGSWGNTYTCATCHSNSTTNIKGVYQIISTPIGRRNVVFDRTSSTSADYAGVYSNDLRPDKNVSTQVCSVCHHQTRQHQYSASKPFGGPNNDEPYVSTHHNGRDCVKCHTHNTAFRSIYGLCGDCHGFKATGYSPVSKGTMVKDMTNALGPSPPNYGAHQRHNIAKMTCGTCHSITNHGLDTTAWQGDNKLEIGFDITSLTFPGFNPAHPKTGGTFYGTNNLNAPFSWLTAPGTTLVPIADYNSSCSTYCHGTWEGNTGSNTTPIWVGSAGQVTCGTCHMATAAVPPTSGSHAKHAGNTNNGIGLACERCHATYGNYTGSAHINGNVEWNMSAFPGATYKGYTGGATGAPAPTASASYGSCRNLYCHSNVQGATGTGAPTYFAAPTWGGTTSCGSCHAEPNNTGSHPSHENEAVSFDCHVCHNSGGTTTASNHANGRINFQFVGLGANTKYMGGYTSIPSGTAYGTCNNSKCHGRYTRAWGTTASSLDICDKCHGSATSPGGFYNTQGPTGSLFYNTTGVGVHDIHIQNPNSPRKASFNRFTSYAAGFKCQQCHTVPTGPFSASHIDTALPAELPFSNESSIANTGNLFGFYSSATYNFSTQVCSNIWCHGDGMNSNRGAGMYTGLAPYVRQNPVWNKPFLTGNGATDCTKCHAIPPAAPDLSYTHFGKTLTTCKDCHTHVANDGHGFKTKSLHVNGIVEGDCNTCHGTPPINNIPGDKNGLVTPPTNALNGGAGAHNTHTMMPAIGNQCYTCHNNYTAEMPSNELEVTFGTLRGYSITGTFTGYTSTVDGPHWKTPGAGTTLVKSSEKGVLCSNIYCHGGGTTTLPALGGGSTTIFDWEGTVACGDCHGIDSANAPAGGSHQKHAQSNPSLSCQMCHGTVEDNGTHVNAAVKIRLQRADALIGASATYGNSTFGYYSTVSINGLAPRNNGTDYKNCNNIYCHSNVQGANGTGVPTTHGTPTWGSAGSMNCDSCHKDNATNTTADSSHKKHANTTPGVGMGVPCGYCHQDAGYGKGLHADGSIFVNFTSYIGGGYSVGTAFSGGMNKSAGSAAYGSCSATFCHGEAASPNWGTPGTLACNACHAAKVDDVNWGGNHRIHYNYSTMPSNYTQTVTDLSTTNKYRFNCAHCHDDNVAKHSLMPASADSAARVFFGISSATPAASSKRGTYVAGTPWGATDNGFYYTSGSCNTSYCHSNGRGGAPLNTVLTWTTTKTAGSNCEYCHAGKSTATQLSGKHDKHMNTGAILGTGNGYNCADCHASTITNINNTTIANKGNHVNAVLNYSGAKALKRNYVAGSGSCSTYCHSNGNPNSTVFVSMTGSKVWTGAATITTCNKCHGRSNAIGYPDYANGGANTATSNLHAGHLAGVTDTTSCADCHRKTASTIAVNVFRPYSTTHLSGAPDVNFNTAKAYVGTKATVTTAGMQVTCSQVVCHGQGAPVWGTSTSANQCQKCHGSRTQAFTNVSAPQVAPGFGGTGTDTSMTKSAPTDPRVGAHQMHLATSAISSAVKCNECHVTVNTIRSANHWNYSTATITFGGRAVASSHSPSVARSAGVMQCSNTYCHSGKYNSGTTMAPAWNSTTVVNETGTTVAECVKCHAMPPSGYANHPAALSNSAAISTINATCGGCHPNLSSTATNVGDAFDDKSLHINGIINATGGHIYSYPGARHIADANASAPYTNCNGCHNATATGGTLAKGTAPNCGACHINMTNFTGATPGCYDCHGSTASSGVGARPNGNAFPNISGSHTKHVVGQSMACSDCHGNHGGGLGDVKHGSYSSVMHTKANVDVLSTGVVGKRFTFTWTGNGTCSTVDCHGTAEWGVTKFNCLTCHSSVINGRAAASAQFGYQSHHIQGIEPLTSAQCYKCHWEANSDGSINTTHHGGQNNPGSSVGLVVWNGTSRPTTATPGTTYISYTANGKRTSIAKLNIVCLGCHNTPNQTVAPFGKYTTNKYAPEQYLATAKPKSSIQSRYSSTRTVQWSQSKYSSAAGGAARFGTNNKAQITKALSAHGNAIKNQFPQFDRNVNGAGDDDWALTDVATATAKTNVNKNVFCYDCHNSHGSDAAGVTSSYSSATGRFKGGLLKSTVNGQGGYTVTYKPAQTRTVTYKQYSAVNTIVATYNSGANICNDCHNDKDSSAAGVYRGLNYDRPWTISGTYSSSKAIVGYWSTPYFDNYTMIPAIRSIYKAGYVNVASKDLRKPMGGHYGSSVNGTSAGHSTGSQYEINGLCTPCHDPHGVSKSALGADADHGVPLLKGTWVTSPYREDKADILVKRGGGCSWSAGIPAGGAVPGYHIDQNTFMIVPLPTNTGAAVATAKGNQRAQRFRSFSLLSSASTGTNYPANADTVFAGLCTNCHNRASLTGSSVATTSAAWKSKERIHQSVKGWGSTNGVNTANKVHAYTCAKCHAPHVSRLPRLLVTNCLDARHFNMQVSGTLTGGLGINSVASGTTTPGNIHQNLMTSSALGAGRFPAGGSRYSGTPNTAQNPGGWWFQTNGSGNTVQPTATPNTTNTTLSTSNYGSACHNSAGASGSTTYDPAKQLWNNKSRW